MLRTLVAAFGVFGVTCLTSCGTPPSHSSLDTQNSGPKTEIVYRGIPAKWDSRVRLAIQRISPSCPARYVVMIDQSGDDLQSYLDFDLYIDHPDHYERVDTYRLGKDGELFVFNLFAEDIHDTWLPFESSP